MQDLMLQLLEMMSTLGPVGLLNIIFCPLIICIVY